MFRVAKLKLISLGECGECHGQLARKLSLVCAGIARGEVIVMLNSCLFFQANTDSNVEVGELKRVTGCGLQRE